MFFNDYNYLFQLIMLNINDNLNLKVFEEEQIYIYDENSSDILMSFYSVNPKSNFQNHLQIDLNKKLNDLSSDVRNLKDQINNNNNVEKNKIFYFIFFFFFFIGCSIFCFYNNWFSFVFILFFFHH